jgi:hypothetical protein
MPVYTINQRHRPDIAAVMSGQPTVVPPRPKQPTPAQGFGTELRRLGWRSVHHWAAANGHKKTTVTQTLNRWAHRTDKEPHGGTAKQIMRRLRRDIAEGRGPR